MGANKKHTVDRSGGRWLALRTGSSWTCGWEVFGFCVAVPTRTIQFPSLARHILIVTAPPRDNLNIVVKCIIVVAAAAAVVTVASGVLLCCGR